MTGSIFVFGRPSVVREYLRSRQGGYKNRYGGDSSAEATETKNARGLSWRSGGSVFGGRMGSSRMGVAARGLPSLKKSVSLRRATRSRSGQDQQQLAMQQRRNRGNVISGTTSCVDSVWTELWTNKAGRAWPKGQGAAPSGGPVPCFCHCHAGKKGDKKKPKRGHSSGCIRSFHRQPQRQPSPNPQGSSMAA